MPSPHFSAVRQDDTRSSHELLPMNMHSSRNTNDKIPNWSEHNDTQNPTFREKWSPFPYRTILTLLLLPLALIPIVTLSSAAEIASQSYIRNLSCYPNGLWKFSPTATWRIMDSSYFFTPNLSFGSMTFTQVKVIDVAWDLLVGRGGQLGLAWVNWRVFNEWLVGWMEHHQASWKIYASLAFQTTSLSSLGVVGKEILASANGVGWKRWSLRWLAMVGMFFSTLYVLSFPTLMAAMTGYIATSEPYIQDLEGNLIAFDKVDVVAYVVNDATRIGYEKPLVVGSRDLDLIESVRRYMYNATIGWQATRPQQPLNIPPLDIPSYWAFDTTKAPLLSPTLNITRYPFDAFALQSISPYSRSMYSTSGRQSTLYNATYMLAHGSCKPSETYQWGFSYIFLFMVSIFNFVWACIMVGMWLEIQHKSRVYRSGRRPGLLRSIVEFAAAIKDEIGERAEELEEEDLKKMLRASNGKLVVPEHELKVRRVETGERAVKRRGWKSSLTRGSTF